MKKYIIQFLVLISMAFNVRASLVIENGVATNITATNAVLYVNLVSTNITNAAVTVYYGAGNGGTNTTLWQYSNYFGVVSTGLYSFTTTNLSPATYIYYRGRGQEGATNIAWASSSSNFTSKANLGTNFPASTNEVVFMIYTNGLIPEPMKSRFITANSLATTNDLAGFENEILAVSTRVDKAEGAISTNATLDLALSNRVLIAEGNITTNSANITSEVARATGTESTLQTNVNTVSNQVVNHIADTNNPHAVNPDQIGAVPTTDPLYGTIGLSMTNYVNIPSSTNWQVYDPVIRTLTGCNTNQGTGGGGGAGTTYYADGSTIKLTGSTFSVAPWITDNLLALRYETWNHFASYSQGLIDGPGYWFDDENGIIAGLSSGYTYQNPGYKNYTGGLTAKALSLNGSTRWTNLVAGLPLGNTGMTVAVWINLVDTNRSGAALAVYGTGGEGFGIGVGEDSNGQMGALGSHLYGNTLSGHNPAARWINSGKKIGTGWHLIGISIGTDRQYLWLDSTNVYTDVTLPIAISTPLVSVGGVPYPECNPETRFTGILDEPMVFARQLVSNDWSILYASGTGYYGNTTAGPTATGLVWASHVDEGSGSTIPDYSGGGVTFYESGASVWTNSIVCVNPSGGGTTNMTLVAAGITLPFLPGYGYASALINVGVETVTTNEIKMYMSRDYGTNYSEATLTQSDTWSVSNKLFAGSATLTNQPVCSNVLIKVTCDGSKTVTVLGVAGPCSAE